MKSPSNNYSLIILLVGLPATCKTTLSRYLLENRHILLNCWNQSEVENPKRNIEGIHIEFDEIFRSRNDLEERKFDPEEWKQSRKEAFQQLKDYLHQWNEMKDDQTLHFVIIDDNMFYRSMRHPYYQIAREWNASFVILYLDSSLDQIILRNMNRKIAERVHEEVIYRMKDKIEPPSQQGWEKHRHLTIHTTHIDDALKSFPWNDLISIWKIPIPPLSFLSEEEKEKSRQITKSNEIHQADVEIRKMIGLILAKQPTKQHLKQISEQLRAKRQLFLHYLRNHSTDYPTSIGNYFLEEYLQSDERIAPYLPPDFKNC